MNKTLPERSEHVADQLAQITAVIRELMGDDLAMVVLFGSYARGDWVNDRYVEADVVYSYESDFDLLIVSEKRAHATQQGEAKLSGAIGRRLRALRLDRPSSTIIVEEIEHLNKALARGQYFFSDIRKEGVLLFDSGRHALAEPAPLDSAEMQQHAREDLEHWFPSAVEFMIDFQHAFDRASYSKAAFELHQAAERFFVTIALSFTRYKPKTHDLEKLDHLASSLHPEFFTVFPRATDQQKRLFELLRSAYIDARYKRDFAITKDELEYLAARVRKLQELTKRICEERIAAINPGG